MDGLEIALLIFAVILIVVSFFLVDKKEKTAPVTVPVPDMKQLNVISERAIKVGKHAKGLISIMNVPAVLAEKEAT